MSSTALLSFAGVLSSAGYPRNPLPGNQPLYPKDSSTRLFRQYHITVQGQRANPHTLSFRRNLDCGHKTRTCKRRPCRSRHSLRPAFIPWHLPLLLRFRLPRTFPVQQLVLRRVKPVSRRVERAVRVLHRRLQRAKTIQFPAIRHGYIRHGPQVRQPANIIQFSTSIYRQLPRDGSQPLQALERSQGIQRIRILYLEITTDTP